MIAHIVLFQPKQNLSLDDKRALLRAFRSALAAVPAVQRVRIGRSTSVGAAYESSTSKYGYAAVIEFAGVPELQGYLRHPAHQELGRMFFEACAATTIVDVELIEGLDAAVERLLEE